MSLKPLDHWEATDSESLSWKSEAFSLHSYHNILIPLRWTAASQGNEKGQTRVRSELLQRRPKQNGSHRQSQCLRLTRSVRRFQDVGGEVSSQPFCSAPLCTPAFMSQDS